MLKKLPCVVRHKKTGAIGLATTPSKNGRPGSWNIRQQDSDHGTVWHTDNFDVVEGADPKEYGFKKRHRRPEKALFYARSRKTGHYGKVVDIIEWYGRKAYRIDVGGHRTRWFASACERITKEEYQSAPIGKRQFMRRSAEARKHTKKIEVKKNGRRCRRCGKDPSPNWFWCPACHYVVCKDKDDKIAGRDI